MFGGKIFRIVNPTIELSHSEKSNGRLGRGSLPKTVVYGVPYPIEVKLPGVRVVSLVAGGMQASHFHGSKSRKLIDM